MSDTTYQTFQHYGTNAERLAFTPNPGLGIQPIYIWFETDTGQTWLYHTTWVQISGVSDPFLPEVDLGNSGAVKDVDWSDGFEQYVVLTDNVEFTFSNPASGGMYTLLTNTGAGGFGITWPANVRWIGGVAPTPTADPTMIDYWTFQYCAALSLYIGTLWGSAAAV
jgi:hypothetical protein